MCLRGTTSERLHNWCTAGKDRVRSHISLVQSAITQRDAERHEEQDRGQMDNKY